MNASHKTFTGGYRFSNFEGQPTEGITVFKPVSHDIDAVVEPGKGVTAAEVLDAFRLTDYTGPENAIVSTSGKIVPNKVKNIIVSAVEAEPYGLPAKNLLTSQTKNKFFEGIGNIHESYPRAQITLVFGDDQSSLMGLISADAEKLNWLNLVTIESKYPANIKEFAVPQVLGANYPVGYGPAHIGLLYLGIKDVFQVAKVVTDKRPADSVQIALAGTGWNKNLVLEVPLGTKIKELTDRYLRKDEMRLVKNSVLTGSVLNPEDVVTYDTDAIIAIPEDRRRQILFFLRGGKNSDSYTNTFLSSLFPKARKEAGTNLHGEKRACLSCTYCQSVCPSGLIPHMLHKHGERNIINKRVAEYGIFSCVECGLCNYVCPSKVEVLANIKLAKEKLEEAEISHNSYVVPKCDMVSELKEVVSCG